MYWVDIITATLMMIMAMTTTTTTTMKLDKSNKESTNHTR
jgi:hypothetical protein